MAVDNIGEDDYARDDEPVDVTDQYRPLAELPRALRAGFGGRQGNDRGDNGGSGALRNFGRPRPYDAVIEGLQARLQAELRAEGAAAAGRPRGTLRQGLPGRVTRRPNPTAAERARRRLLERNIRGIPILSKDDSEPRMLSSGDVPSINLRRSDLDRNRPLRSPFPRFEKNLLDMLQFGNFDEDAIRYYLSMISQSGSSHGYPPEFGNLDVILANDARPNPEGIVRQQWTPTKVLGSGSYGEVILWQRITNFATRPESLVCKTTYMDNFFLDWNEEAVLTQKLNAAGCPNVLKVYDWNHNKHENLARIIYEYCPHGDLQSLIDFYDTQLLVFPEAFMWHIFQSVATAICYCARGTTDDEPRPGWTEIVHKDLKPNNIFLSPPDHDENPLYPTLKVADFGLGYQIPNETIRQFKRSYRSYGNVFGAPEVHEQLRSDKAQTPYDLPSPRLDIYSLGIIMLVLLQMPIAHYTPREWECLDLALPYSHKYYPYSPTLVALARACIHPDARQRPDPLTLYRDTRAYAQAMTHDTLGLRRRAYAQGNPAGVYNGKVLWLAADRDKYRSTDTYRRAFRRHADWFGRHANDVVQLEVAALEPRWGD
ncbi:Serine/threonine/dual specificity protein kinase, catalytic domain [Lasallia pustulata]|uniref:non-specific serine/threonine protein kinase n=1 Tax=Lasallia pustulata TaxID=136370 RepID=A0A1W5CRY9_9LECA|nr:Serine/threonine/dual specificity protein kinase, catalytic domain [Lasallia pustulata]